MKDMTEKVISNGHEIVMDNERREVFISASKHIEEIDLINLFLKECKEREIPNVKVIGTERSDKGIFLKVDEESKRCLFGYKMPRREAYLLNIEVVDNEVLHVVDDEEYYQLGVIEDGKYRDEQVYPQDKEDDPYIEVEIIEYLLRGQGYLK